MKNLINICLCMLIPLAVCSVQAEPVQKMETVDFMDYFLQTDDTENAWTIDGTDVREDIDPDGTDTQTYILNKFHSSNFYEVFKLVDDELQIRYEVFRAGGKEGKGSWIRRFEEIDGKGKAPGSIWCKRYVVPGGEGFFTKFRQDRYIFDEKTKSYVPDESGNIRYFPNYTRFVWAEKNSLKNNKTGFKFGRLLRMVSEWQREGISIEMYDYAKGKGMVDWRWLERISTLQPVKEDKTGRIFHCMDGYVEVVPGAESWSKPAVYQYDISKKKRGRGLGVVKEKSVWRPGLGEQWYVVYRHASRENPIRKTDECIPHDFTLPEWTSKPGATIKDLPYVNTNPPKD
ncbi:MAG: hypothetical protein ACYC27_19480 [Armatimonadota bacterium]